MTKAAILSLGLAALVVFPATVPAQDSSASLAVNEAIVRQANAIVLRQKLSDAKAVAQRGDIVNAAKLYQEAVTLAQKTGSGIDVEMQQAVAGLAATRLALARDAQSRHDLREADVQVKQVLFVDPKNADAIAFKQHNDEMLAAMKGKMPDTDTLDKIPLVVSDKIAAGTLVQDGKLLAEMGKYNEAEVKLNEATKLDPDNNAAFYELTQIQQARVSRDNLQHNTDTQVRMEHVEKQWILPTSTVNLPIPNPYITNNVVYTGPGRQAIMARLNRIHLDNVSYDGLPLSEVLRQLGEQCKLRDPERKGINFLINNNPDLSGQPVAAQVTPLGGNFGRGGGGVPTAVDPATGLPAAPAADAGGAAAGEVQDVGAFTIKIPSLTDVRLADVLDAIIEVADHPIKYSIRDFAIVFSAKGPETPQLFTREFRVDPNTFYSGLESVSSQTFGSSSSTGGGGGQGGGGGGGGGGRGGGGGGGNSGGNGQSSGAVVGVVNAFSGSGSLRSQGGLGGGGGGGGNAQGANNPLNTVGGGAGGNVGGQGGLNYVTQVTLAQTPSQAVMAFFAALGVNLQTPVGKAVFFNDRLGVLLVKATETDLDTIERAIQVLNRVPPQVHIKSRFIEVSQTDDNELGFDWSVGQFSMGNKVVGQAGSSPSLNVPVSVANPSGVYPGNNFPATATAAAVTTVTPISTADQLLTSGLRNSAPTLATFTGILTDPNFRVALRALSQRSGFENLGEPEATTISGRQVQMKATSVRTVVTGLNFTQGSAPQTAGVGTGTGG